MLTIIFISLIVKRNAKKKITFSTSDNITAVTKIANTIKFSGKSTDTKTISKYLEGLCKSLVVYENPKYNIKGKEYLSATALDVLAPDADHNGVKKINFIDWLLQK